MHKYFFLLIILFSSVCLAQNNNPQPPFSNVYRRPNIHPYTFINPDNNAMDYQQMFYLQNKTENLINDNNSKPLNRQYNRYYIPPSPNLNLNIRPTGHKSYFMTLP